MENIIKAPVSGFIQDITACSDSVFAEKMLGDGVIIRPSQNQIFSPITGKVTQFSDTKHAITIQSDDGLTILLHIGIDTVELKGEGFSSFVVLGQDVKAGSLLLDFDRDLISERGYEDTVILINLSSDSSITKLQLENEVSVQSEIIKIIF
ncbi:PTS sugar transporter subunit IIA [Enterococcus columbae]|uniref:PTS EIIA type-1 domain-containing protein n=1 Tax=Enterococcus columbae DSM 7374 = ATCC 51263 TaxID=1121865 RepID=S1NFC9_9ENTE|nr:PTS glucose transporter subunit IIA [Enterococcus columbae]EOT38574.1 hypothetical protein OMW_02214 [Enterococcus columbae DSM 7374 = ATCC 51263]EOW87775.1 hypothetical protein I568_00061 [Enterococcus columbae DSM 7374 = ATCC 51263]OJG19767.1 hypothetical protein RR47_GL001728 [Enterococcus columbae DSM 7374 = ATCC 51263]